MQVRLLVVLMAACLGCNQGADYAPVSGRITLDGKPLEGALISFQPLATGDSLEVGVGSSGEADADGRYVLKGMIDKQEGALVGPHRVMITTLKGEEGPNGETIFTSQERVPEKYQDYDNPLKFEVPPEGTDKADFALESGRKN